MKIAESIGILAGALSFAGERQGREVEQIAGRSVLRIEFVRVLRHLIRRKIFTELQDRAIDWFNPKLAEGRWFLEHATQVKNIRVPYGE
ncbi:MAG: hypothetical protein ABR861_02085 [Terriglobales bacterium]|jgi:hypothetical protein